MILLTIVGIVIGENLVNANVVGNMNEKEMQLLLECIKDLKHKQRCFQAVYLLEQMASDAAPAIPALIETLISNEISLQAAIALGKIGKAAVPSLIKAMESQNPKIKKGAAV